MSSSFEDPLEYIIGNIDKIDLGKSELELELRFMIDGRKKNSVKSKTYSIDETKKIISHIIKEHEQDAKIEQTINFMRPDGAIKQLYFVDGEQKKEKNRFYLKKKIIEPIIINSHLVSYKLSISSEAPLEEFNINECQMARIRLRCFFILSVWRIDITFIKNINNLDNPVILKQSKKEMLYDIKMSNFIEKAPWDVCDYIEIEAENIDLKPKTLANDIKFIGEIMEKLCNIRDESESGGEYQEKIYQIANLLVPEYSHKYKSEYGLKQLSNQVIELTKNIFFQNVLSNIENYYITDKIDGKRTLIFVSDGNIYAVSDILENIGKGEGIYVIDTEFYNDEYYIFDVMIFNNEKLYEKPFEKRLEYFGKCSKLFKFIKEKPFIKLTEKYISQISSFKKEKKKYETDGIIMTPANESYNEMKVYKYKPVDKLTIDFLIKKCPQKLLGIKPFINKTGSKGTLYILFCGISKKQYTKLNLRFIRYYENIFGDSIKDEDYFPIQFEPSDKQFSYLFWGEPDLDGKIGEFLYLNKEWRLQKIRDDRQVELKRGNYYGNNYKIAELIWINYEDPLIIEKLTVNEMIYFKKNDNPIYKPSRNFNSFVKSRIIESYNSEWVFDLASGKGQDLFRYTNGNYQNILFCEIDRNAISELINRKHDFAKNDNYNSLGIHVQCVDLLKKYKDNIDQISENLPMLPKQVNLIICNFAFHYFLRNKLTTSNICKFISHYLKPGGRFVFSAFDGVKIVELMNETGGKWMVKENDILKYSIIKKYKGDFLVDIGQMINVLLPFSDEEYYPEYLINIKYIEAEFMKYKIKLELSKSFADYIEEYKHNNREKYAEMSENDIKFCSLYSWYSFYRNV